MGKNRKVLTKIGNYVFLGIILGAAFTAVFYDLYIGEISEKMRVVGKQVAYNMSIRLEGELDLLDAISRMEIIQQEDTPNEEKLSYLKREVHPQDYIRMGMVEENGMAMTTDGHQWNLSNRTWFQKAINGMPNVSNLLEDVWEDGEEIIVFAVPIIHNQDVKEVLFATYQVSILTQFLEQACSNDRMIAYLVNENNRKIGGNIGEDDISIEDLNPRTGYSRQKIDGQAYYLIQEQIPHTPGWKVVVGVEAKGIARAITSMLLLTGILIIALIIIIFGLVVRFKKERRKQYDKMNQMTMQDELTGLSSYKKFCESANHQIHQCDDRNYAFIKFNINQFQKVNRLFGYDFGDELLKEIAKVLQEVEINACQCLVTRAHSDDFMMFMPYQNLEDILRWINKIQNEIENKKSYIQSNQLIGMTYLIVRYPEDANSLSDLIKMAEMSMKIAKKSSLIGIQWAYEVSAQEEKKEQMELDLQRAIEIGELVLYYQSKVNMSTGEVVGVEALIRWKKGEEMIAPYRFIPFAEESGLIIKISDWVLEEACWQIKKWQSEGYFIPVAVNISAVEFYQSDLIKRIQYVLEKTGISPEFLEIELTETVAMIEIDQAIRIIQKIKDLGIAIALDDFGTGYSSLSYLQKLPIKYVKLDRMFLKDIASDRVSYDVVRSIIKLTEILDLIVIAEGVEEVIQQKVLGELGCTIGQGYLFAYPKTADEWHLDQQANSRR